MIKVFKDNYNREEFYRIMGKFFAEPTYRKDLPYMANRDNSIWHVFIEDGNVKAFSSYEIRPSIVDFKTDYFVDDIKFLEEILKYKLKELEGLNKPIETATNNNEIKALFESYGFKEFKKSTNYSFLLKGDRNAGDK